MANVSINEKHLTDIANAIRSKNGANATYKPREMAAAIRSISSSDGFIESTLNMLDIKQLELLTNEIPEYTFNNCKNLERFKSTAIRIGQYAFRHCTFLSRVILRNVETMGECPFYGCRLSYLDVGSHVQNIDLRDVQTQLLNTLIIRNEAGSDGSFTVPTFKCEYIPLDQRSDLYLYVPESVYSHYVAAANNGEIGYEYFTIRKIEDYPEITDIGEEVI